MKRKACFLLLFFSGVLSTFTHASESGTPTLYERLKNHDQVSVYRLIEHIPLPVHYELSDDEKKHLPDFILKTRPRTITEKQGIEWLLSGYGVFRGQKVIGIGHALADAEKRAVRGDRAAYEMLVQLGYSQAILNHKSEKAIGEEQQQFFFSRWKDSLKRAYQKISPLETREERYQRLLREGKYLVDESAPPPFTRAETMANRETVSPDCRPGISGTSLWSWFFGLLLASRGATTVASSLEGFTPLVSQNFTDIQQNPAGKYYLGEDIHFDRHNITLPLFNETTPFQGVLLSGINNESHSIYGGSHNVSSPDFSVFGTLENSYIEARFRNTRIENHMENSDSAPLQTYTGVLGSIMKDGNHVDAEFENCSVKTTGKNTLTALGVAAVYGTDNVIRGKTVNSQIMENDPASSSYSSGASALVAHVRGDHNRFLHRDSTGVTVQTVGESHVAALSIGAVDETYELELRQENITDSRVESNGAYSSAGIGIAKMQLPDFQKISITQKDLENVEVREHHADSRAGVAIGELLFYPATTHTEKLTIQQENLANITIKGNRVALGIGEFTPLTGNQVIDGRITQINTQGQLHLASSREPNQAASTINFNLCAYSGCNNYQMHFQLFSGELITSSFDNSTAPEIVNTGDGNIICTDESLWDTSGYRVPSNGTMFEHSLCPIKKLETHKNTTAWHVAHESLCQHQKCDGSSQFCNYVNEETQTLLSGPDQELLLLSRQRYPYNFDADAHGMLRLTKLVTNPENPAFNQTGTTLYPADGELLKAESVLVSHRMENNQLHALYASSGNTTQLISLPVTDLAEDAYQVKTYHLSGKPLLLSEHAVWTCDGSNIHRYERAGENINTAGSSDYHLPGSDPVLAITHDSHWLYVARVGGDQVLFQRFNLGTGLQDHLWHVENQAKMPVNPDTLHSLLYNNGSIVLLQKGSVLLPANTTTADETEQHEALGAELAPEGGCASWYKIPVNLLQTKIIVPSPQPSVTTSLPLSQSDQGADVTSSPDPQHSSTAPGSVYSKPVFSITNNSRENGKANDNTPYIITGVVVSGLAMVAAVGTITYLAVKKTCHNSSASSGKSDGGESRSKENEVDFSQTNPLYMSSSMLDKIELKENKATGHLSGNNGSSGKIRNSTREKRKKSKKTDPVKGVVFHNNPRYISPEIQISNPIFDENAGGEKFFQDDD